MFWVTVRLGLNRIEHLFDCLRACDGRRGGHGRGCFVLAFDSGFVNQFDQIIR